MIEFKGSVISMKKWIITYLTSALLLLILIPVVGFFILKHNLSIFGMIPSWIIFVVSFACMILIIVSEVRIQKIRKNKYNIDVKRYIDKLPN